MRLTVRADASLYGLLVFQGWILMSVVIVRPGQNISFELNGVQNVVPESRIAGLAFILVI